MSKLGFPRDRTSRGTSRDKKVSLFHCPFVPGQKRFCLSRCPFVPGQGQVQKSRDKLFCPRTNRGKKISKQKKINLKTKSKIVIFLFFFSFCTVAVPGYSGTGRDRLSKSCPAPSRDKISKSRPGPFRGKILSLSHCPLSRDKEGTSVPLSLCPGTMKGLLSLCPAGQENPVPLDPSLNIKKKVF